MDNTHKIISDLCHFSPRQGKNEELTAKYLESYLTTNNIDFLVETFDTQVPIIIRAELFLDGQLLPCLGSSFASGEITSKSQVQFSKVSDFIETVTYSLKPSVCISRTQRDLLNKASHISGNVVVDEYSFQSRNIVVGNTSDPEKIIFSHYDGLGGGALDNAGSVSVCLGLLTENRDLISKNLFVFVGNEELSYDHPNYWGKGYREFEKEHFNLLNSSKEIIIVDGVGVTEPTIVTRGLDDAFPIKNLSNLLSKITWISSVQSEVMKCYHCLEDTPDKLDINYLEQSVLFLKQKLLTLPEAGRMKLTI